MQRRRYLLTYDISDDKRRTKVFHLLRDHGDHAQYSVFLCELSNTELAALRGRLSKELHHREDQLLIIDLGKATSPLENDLECLGKPYQPLTRVFII